ncbi:MAG: L-histidine N(alpha)-methyltransferase [Bryobacterales bacterium]|nr:L-histidine N(alpha)-methyltransferase [Bryobacterales bacterium]
MPLPDFAAFLTIDEEACSAVATALENQVARQDSSFARDVAAGLTHPLLKEISSSWLYDELGSVLFEAITLLPEYGLTRADERVIQRAAPVLAATVGANPFVAELGSGSGKKTRAILSEFLLSGAAGYAPIDVSLSALEGCCAPLAALEGLALHPTVGSYLDGLALALRRREPGQRALLLFLGSTIGNFAREELPGFLTGVRKLLDVGDYFLVGADLEKSPSVLELAYDDPVGVTAAFNKNLLAHLNTAFAGDFDLGLFAHRAVYNLAERRIEMYLESTARQRVTLRDLDLRIALEAGERIRTEFSHKFNLPELRQLATLSGFAPGQEWCDTEWPFAECLWRAE